MARKLRSGYGIKHSKPKWQQEKERAELVDAILGIALVGAFFALMSNNKSANKSTNKLNLGE